MRRSLNSSASILITHYRKRIPNKTSRKQNYPQQFQQTTKISRPLETANCLKTGGRPPPARETARASFIGAWRRTPRRRPRCRTRPMPPRGRGRGSAPTEEPRPPPTGAGHHLLEPRRRTPPPGRSSFAASVRLTSRFTSYTGPSFQRAPDLAALRERDPRVGRQQGARDVEAVSHLGVQARFGVRVSSRKTRRLRPENCEIGIGKLANRYTCLELTCRRTA